jgi:hypothetical protein
VTVPKFGGNLGDIQVLGNGSDGSLFFKSTIARDTYDSVLDEDPGIFKSQTASYWVTTTQDKERIFSAGEWANPSVSAPYLSNF